MALPNAIDMVKWCLTHAKKETIPKGATLCLPLAQCGTDPWEYCMGTTGHKCTASLLESKRKKYYTSDYWNKNFAAATKGFVEKGVMLCDCQGLADCYRTTQLGIKTDKNAKGNYADWCTDKGKIKDITRPYVIGEAVFTNTPSAIKHVGFVCGFDYDGVPLLVEERGLNYGCVITRMDIKRDNPWTLRGLMTKVFAYPGQPVTPVEPHKPEPAPTPAGDKWVVSRVLKLADPTQKGDDVKELQKRIYEFGIRAVELNGGTKKLVADGTFGPISEVAVKLYQKAVGLTVDGKAGKNTIIKLGGTWGG